MASSKSFIATCLRACYAVTLGLLMCVDGVVCKLALITPDWLVAREKREGLALVLSHYAFAAALALSPWIRVVADGDLGPVWADVVGHIRNEADARPLFLVGNHTSFLDTVLTVAKAPIALIYRSRTYVSSHLLSMPVLGTVINAMGERQSGNRDQKIPFRDSKLTHVLKTALQGSAKTLMFVNINPGPRQYQESLSSLKFANRVGNVEVGPAQAQRERR